jgi:uncharacterized protein YwgA
MNRLQLATLLSWAGDNGLHGRKRLQKVVYFLQEAGCPLNCGYILHHFGPYSWDVADRCDEMVAAGLVLESGGPSNGAMQYSYTLKPEIRVLLQQTRDEQMQRFQGFGTSLINKDIWKLELGATILMFYRQSRDWERALAGACGFKKVPTDAEASQKALELAKSAHTQVQN